MVCSVAMCADRYGCRRCGAAVDSDFTPFSNPDDVLKEEL